MLHCSHFYIINLMLTKSCGGESSTFAWLLLIPSTQHLELLYSSSETPLLSRRYQPINYWETCREIRNYFISVFNSLMFLFDRNIMLLLTPALLFLPTRCYWSPWLVLVTQSDRTWHMLMFISICLQPRYSPAERCFCLRGLHCIVVQGPGLEIDQQLQHQ